MHIYRYLVLAATAITYPTAQSIAFYGDTSLSDYLSLLCARIVHTQSALIVLDRVLAINESSISLKENQFGRYFEQIHCSFAHYSNVSTEELSLLLKNNLHWRHRQLILLFDLTVSMVRIDARQFAFALTALDRLYLDCVNCAPFLVLFDATSEQIWRWSSQVMPTLKRDFRSMLKSIEEKTEASLLFHIHPVLNGCHQHPGVFVPREKVHFDLLKVPFQLCNLNSSTLNVSFNNVLYAVLSIVVFDFFCFVRRKGLPYCNIMQQNGQTEVKFAMETEILKILQSRFNFKSNLIDGKQVWGMFTEGRWTGVVGQVYNRVSFAGWRVIQSLILTAL